MPEFHENITSLENWKAKVLDRRIELEEIDTEQFTARYGAKG